MDRRSVACGIGGFVIGTLSGCLSDIPGSTDEKQEITRMYDASDDIELHVRNENGPVTVRTYGDDVINVTIEIRGGSTETIDAVSVTDERRSNALILETKSGNEGGNARVALTIQIPPVVSIGPIQTSNASLSVDIPDIDGETDIVTSNGSTDVRLANDLDAEVIATTTNSSVNVNDLDLKSVEKSDTGLTGVLGGGTHSLSIETTNASIELGTLAA